MSSCASDPVVYGESASVAALEERAVAVSALPAAGPVVVRGEVGQVCKMGCWFFLLDPTGLQRIELDLATGFVIPPDSIGKEAIVAGTLRTKASQRVLQADTVILR